MQKNKTKQNKKRIRARREIYIYICIHTLLTLPQEAFKDNNSDLNKQDNKNLLSDHVKKFYTYI